MWQMDPTMHSDDKVFGVLQLLTALLGPMSIYVQNKKNSTLLRNSPIPIEGG